MIRAFLDTNVVVYAYDRSEPEKRRRAIEILGVGGPQLVVSTQVMAEFFVVVTRKLSPPLDLDSAAAVVADLKEFEVITTDAQLVERSISTSREHQLSLWDALIVEAAVLGGCDVLYTEDLSEGATIRGVEVVNPFRS